MNKSKPNRRTRQSENRLPPRRHYLSTFETHVDHPEEPPRRKPRRIKTEERKSMDKSHSRGRPSRKPSLEHRKRNSEPVVIESTSKKPRRKTSDTEIIPHRRRPSLEK
jgi:hypothetical protein